jgi:hypothetical protein
LDCHSVYQSRIRIRKTTGSPHGAQRHIDGKAARG